MQESWYQREKLIGLFYVHKQFCVNMNTKLNLKKDELCCFIQANATKAVDNGPVPFSI